MAYIFDNLLYLFFLFFLLLQLKQQFLLLYITPQQCVQERIERASLIMLLVASKELSSCIKPFSMCILY